MNTNHFKVRIQCPTYNHAFYIVDAMNGFCMQQTDFPFLAVVVDDASTDGEPEVIKKYLAEYFDNEALDLPTPDETDEYVRVFARHKENKNCYFLVMFLKYNHYSIKKAKLVSVADLIRQIPYIALCEGDDYWTDPRKLQRQVDFMEEHPEYSLCCHRFKIHYENTDTWTDDFAGKAFAENTGVEGLDVTNSENFRTRFTSTLTLCYRKASLEGIDWPPYKFGRRDFNFHYHLLKAGKGWCFADYMGVYRKHDGGIWSSLSSLDGAQTRLECYEDLYKYNKDDKVVQDRYVEWLDLFFVEFVRPSFHYHGWTRNGIDNLKLYVKHCLKTKQYCKAVRKSLKCLGLVIGIKE